MSTKAKLVAHTAISTILGQLDLSVTYAPIVFPKVQLDLADTITMCGFVHNGRANGMLASDPFGSNIFSTLATVGGN
ncbi:hypothetical protein KIN20_034225 [Parelaphostrongylus tenuis]|uniref:Uncharacterized protein n=1 Tax=Parelaphostrongylus tenuis TaxID=148309 RepID=A0AAD5RA15_PARTN|nr:hypothetical protein KIN20_034225 [Parelaphostrongylus tenuis]